VTLRLSDCELCVGRVPFARAGSWSMTMRCLCTCTTCTCTCVAVCGEFGTSDAHGAADTGAAACAVGWL
jgi:hypothetical protein